MLQADERASRRFLQQTEELRGQSAQEKEIACQHERELARHKYVQYTCTAHMYSTHVQYTCTVHMYSTHVQYTYTAHIYSTHVQHTYTAHMYSTHVHVNFSKPSG